MTDLEYEQIWKLSAGLLPPPKRPPALPHRSPTVMRNQRSKGPSVLAPSAPTHKPGATSIPNVRPPQNQGFSANIAPIPKRPQELGKTSFFRELLRPDVGTPREGLAPLEKEHSTALRKEGFRPAHSSNIDGLSYSRWNKNLTVRFKNGSTYRYDGVTPNQWREMKKSPSLGKWLNAELKKKGVPFQKLSSFWTRELVKLSLSRSMGS